MRTVNYDVILVWSSNLLRQKWSWIRRKMHHDLLTVQMNQPLIHQRIDSDRNIQGVGLMIISYCQCYFRGYRLNRTCNAIGSLSGTAGIQIECFRHIWADSCGICTGIQKSHDRYWICPIGHLDRNQRTLDWGASGSYLTIPKCDCHDHKISESALDTGAKRTDEGSIISATILWTSLNDLEWATTLFPLIATHSPWYGVVSIFMK